MTTPNHSYAETDVRPFGIYPQGPAVKRAGLLSTASPTPEPSLGRGSAWSPRSSRECSSPVFRRCSTVFLGRSLCALRGLHVAGCSASGLARRRGHVVEECGRIAGYKGLAGERPGLAGVRSPCRHIAGGLVVWRTHSHAHSTSGGPELAADGAVLLPPAPAGPGQPRRGRLHLLVTNRIEVAERGRFVAQRRELRSGLARLGQIRVGHHLLMGGELDDLPRRYPPESRSRVSTPRVAARLPVVFSSHESRAVFSSSMRLVVYSIDLDGRHRACLAGARLHRRPYRIEAEPRLRRHTLVPSPGR
jgi:hypothetical protein